MLKISSWSKIVGANLLLGYCSMTASIANAESVLDHQPQDLPLLELMGEFESSKDPKCHATATRLEGLIYGTPLSKQARYLKTEYQKDLVRSIWQIAAVRNPASAMLSEAEVNAAAATLFVINSKKVANELVWLVSINDQTTEISQRDQQHYGSIAYTMRAMLAVQQDVLLDFDAELPELSDAAAKAMTKKVDLLTLALLKNTDTQARLENAYEISAAHIQQNWSALIPDRQPKQNIVVASSVTDPSEVHNSGLLMGIIDQKIKSFEEYNDINQTLFARNLQVYFAKLSMPDSPSEMAEFKRYFTEAMIAFSGTLYLDSQSRVVSGTTINEAAVADSLESILPHTVNEYEDVIFYPKFPKQKQVIIESYDMDAFRDSGLHWVYFKEAIIDAQASVRLEADPFAAELISEAIAHYGVLLLRNAGKEGKRIKQKSLSASLITASYHSIESTIANYAKYTPAKVEKSVIVSADTQPQPETTRYFSNVTTDKGLIAEHRSSDWLSRLLRSYLEKNEHTGIITIPPAFGGSGVAAEDINNDGLVDILILSGIGNRLFLNRGDRFVDVTQASGLSNLSQRKGSDGRAGEPRQPLIADFDNDGDQDIVITYVDETHRVYRNDGQAKFVEVTAVANLGGSGLVGGPATTFDVNNDGLLDIYIEYFGNYLNGDLPTLKRRNDNGGTNVLFINKGNFKFEMATNALGADNNGWGQAVTHADLNMDGWQDLIVGNDFGVNAYYINQAGKGFVDAAAAIGIDKPTYTMNLSVTDLNRDGIADIYVSNIVTMNKDQKYVLPSEDTTTKFNPEKMANMRVVEGNDLFISNKSASGQLKYQLSDLVGRGYTSTGWAWDADFFDVDNDSDDDLYVLNGMNDYYVYSSDNPYYSDPHTGESINAEFPDAAKASNVFFLNSGGKLNNVSAVSGLDFIGNSRSASYLDFDNDGDLDVVVNNYHGTAKLFQNHAEKLNNNWLKIRLQGAPESGVNLDGIGAQIIVGTENQGYSWRQVSGSQGYMSVHPKEQHLGLGKATSAKVAIIWPNGQRQFFDNVAANKSYTIRYAQQVTPATAQVQGEE
ncbi:CRTAC1 family protein [Shewanella youngdeokensis]|uniref:CRTAC1 family protein n=1 Tax=Shewanella youngdeokensis TaxID=2999068 RepID=A0ABZ0K174_9GAMM|nr:CRTAC1 family protein [Shewanella sp. DAU334]